MHLTPRRWKRAGAGLLGALLLTAIGVWIAGGVLVAPANHTIGSAPADLPVENVEFPSASGSHIHGWFVPGAPGRGAVILMHGVHADRTTLVDRARFLSRAGYAVLLFDFQAHGESPGKSITFGHLESRDAIAAVDFMRHRLPGEHLGVIGISMGAAAALLADPPLPVEALVLESCYPTIVQATANRLDLRFGWPGKAATPLLTCQLQPRLGIRPEELAPLTRAREIPTPKFFLAGTADRDTTIAESRALFAAAADPKQAWWLGGARHEDLHAFAGHGYERRILAFLAPLLQSH
jgi:dipeptidyl aminopeptidase/acylaminoacyl peptidase